MARRRRAPIRIKKKNQGALRRSTGTKKSKNPTTRRRANFALNARKWRKGGRRKR